MARSRKTCPAFVHVSTSRHGVNLLKLETEHLKLGARAGRKLCACDNEKTQREHARLLSSIPQLARIGLCITSRC